MKAGGNAYDVNRCGVTHHYTTYRLTDRIEWGGQLTPPPSGPWEVKLKVKRCNGQTFETVRQMHARGEASGYASGVLPNLARGYYFGHLYYYQGGNATESDKEYFLLR